MQKRRDRIEQWRSARKKNQEVVQTVILPPSKKWSLEDDDDEDDDAGTGGGADKDGDDEVDPLDAYMQVLHYFPLQSEGDIKCTW